MKKNFKYISTVVIPFFIGSLIGIMLIEFIIKPNIGQAEKLVPEYKPEYKIWHNDNTGLMNKLYCDSFQFKNPYYIEYWYKGRKVKLSSIKPIGVDTND